MTRRELRENTFKMLFRVEFHNAEEIPEQFTLFEEEITGLSDEDRAYLTDKCNDILQKSKNWMQRSTKCRKAGRRVVWVRWILL